MPIHSFSGEEGSSKHIQSLFSLEWLPQGEESLILILLAHLGPGGEETW